MAVYEYENNVSLKPYAKEYLKKLKTNGVKLAIATANSEKYYIPCLKKYKILDYFDHIYDVSKTNGGKESPDIYLNILKDMGFKASEVAVFEDIPRAIKTAKDAGFYVVAVDDITEVDDINLKKELADLFIESFESLL